MSAPSPRPRERMGGVGAVLEIEFQRALRAGASGSRVVLVEGASDRRAVETLARRSGLNLEAEGITVVAMAGITNATRFLDLLGPKGLDVVLAGLYDEPEEQALARSLARTGFGDGLTGSTIEELGFFMCVRDLEDELIRALGADALEALIHRQGELRRFRRFQTQLAQREKSVERQLWRWMGNRKIRYASALVDALEPARIPLPLQGLLDRMQDGRSRRL